MRILGLDLGDKRVGVAISDPQQILAIPLTVILRDSDDGMLKAVKELVHQYTVERIVIGLPRTLEGEIGEEARKVQSFSHQFSQKIGIPIETWDERLSSVAAERLLLEAGVKGKKRKVHRDALAAVFMLQGYLDHKRQRR